MSGLRVLLGRTLMRAALWLLGPIDEPEDELGPVPEDDPDLPTPAQDPLTEESRAMMAPPPLPPAPAPEVAPLEGSAAARYREARRGYG